MGEDMDLVWRTAKSQLYLSEAAHVKKLVGPERIRRNKDALRELRCFQEILGDLHAGQFGRAPERHRAAEEAQRRWEVLKFESQQRGLKPEAVCQVAPSLLSYVHCIGSGGASIAKGIDDDLESGETTTSSTRAPSTAIALDEQSLATAEMVSEITSMVDDIWHSTEMTTRKRRQNTELKKLAVELTEQLDQEYTALMASIEEIQALMEAEVAGDARLPSVEDLEGFARQIDVALLNLEAEKVETANKAKDLEAVLEISDVFSMDAPVTPAVLVPERTRRSRPRWADLNSDSENDPTEIMKVEQKLPEQDAAVACCARCERFLRKSSFSRRAWRQVRGKGSLGERKERHNAWCRECTESGKG